MKVNISNPKTGQSTQRDASEEQRVVFAGKKIGSEVQLDSLGLNGVTGVITGGSDKDGFPMRSDVKGVNRRKILLSGGTGLKNSTRGFRQKKTVRGNTVTEETSQVNVRIKDEEAEKAKAFFEASTKKEPQEAKDATK